MKTNLVSLARELKALGVSKLHLEFSDKAALASPELIKPAADLVNGQNNKIVNKVCKGCGYPKRETEFYRSKRNGALDPYCKLCFKDRMDAVRRKKKVQKSLSEFRFTPDL